MARYRGFDMNEEDEAFEELAKRQGDWGLQGSRKHQIMRYLENNAMREVQRLGQEIEPVALPCCGYTDASAVKWNPFNNVVQCHNCGQVYTSQPQRTEQEPVAWLLTDKNINSLQVDSIQRLIDRLKHAHHTDLCVRINGQDEWFQADWLKHMVRASPPQRTWVGLTDDEIVLISADCAATHQHMDIQFAKAIEAALKAKNT